ncbi:MAG TPA: hypothetical protein VIL39_06375, partial [Verrucomicrobiae bacterium]
HSGVFAFQAAPAPSDATEHAQRLGLRWGIVHSHYLTPAKVEFTTYDGRTVAVAKVSADQIRSLGSKEIHHARALTAET